MGAKLIETSACPLMILNLSLVNSDEKADSSAWVSLFVPEPIQRSLNEEGFTTPTPIQQMVLPAAIKGRLDILGAAETGSGKTLAFGIPILANILDDLEREKQEHDDVETEDESVRDEDDDSYESDMSDQGVELGCVRVINDVKFDFDGETEVYAPPMEVMQELERLRDEFKSKIAPKRRLRGLVLCPTRELAVQVKNHLETAARHTDLKIAVLVGGMAPQKQRRLLSYGPEIVVATPGRLWDLIQEGEPHLADIKSIRYLAIDETDRMVEKGHFEELHKLLELLNADDSTSTKRQTFVFSATLSLVHEAPKYAPTSRKKKKLKKLTAKEKLKEVMALIGVKKRHKVVDLTRKFGTVETLTESRIHASLTEKDFYLYYFTQMHPGRTLVFCNSIDCVRRLVNLFDLLRCKPLGLHAQMHQKQRLKNLERFSGNPNGLLVATDVAARGLDIKDIEHVVHYQVPATSESYIHRSGRTARASKEGISVMLIDPSENNYYRKMCRTLNRDEDLPLFPIEKGIWRAIKSRVELAREVDRLLLRSRKKEIDSSWWKKAAEEADIELSDAEAHSDDEIRNASMRKSDMKTEIKTKQRQLHDLLQLPIMSQSFSGKYPTKSGSLHLPANLDGRGEKSALVALQSETEKTKELMQAMKKAKKKSQQKKAKRRAKKRH